jgi:hypothetical protein
VAIRSSGGGRSAIGWHYEIPVPRADTLTISSEKFRKSMNESDLHTMERVLILIPCHD